MDGNAFKALDVLDAFGKKIITESDQLLALLGNNGLETIDDAQEILAGYLRGCTVLPFRLEAFGRKIITESNQLLSMLKDNGLRLIAEARLTIVEYLQIPNITIKDGPPCPGCPVQKVELICGKKIWPCLSCMWCIYGK